MMHFSERHGDKIVFILSCYDRIVLTGSLADVGHVQAMTRFIKRMGDGVIEPKCVVGRQLASLSDENRSVAAVRIRPRLATAGRMPRRLCME